MIGTLLAGKAALLKGIAITVVVLAVLGTIFAGYRYVSNLQARSEQLAANLASKTLEAALEKASKNAIAQEASTQIKRLQELEAARARAETEATALRQELSNLHLQETFDRDPTQAVRDLVARSRQLNRLLEDASRPAGSPGHGAR